MQTTTVGHLLRSEHPPGLGHVIYVVRDGALIFYVGQSRRDIVTRFHEHVQQPSRLGQLIAHNRPAALDWRVDFYALADCRPYVVQKRLFADQAWEHFDMDMAEQAMIRALRPVVNRDFNPQPTPLPATYRGHAVLAQSSGLQLSAAGQDAGYRLWLNKMSLAGWVQVTTEDGRLQWQHRNGRLLSEEAIAPYRRAGTLPPPADA